MQDNQTTVEATPPAEQPSFQPAAQPGPQPKVSTWSRGWQLFRSSWRVFKLDKELTLMPVFSSIISLVVVAAFLVIPGAIHGFTAEVYKSPALDLGNWVWLFWFGFYVALTTIGNYFAGAVIYGAMERFRGGDPTVKSSFAGVNRNFKPLFLFSLMMTTIGLILQALEERVPFAGKIALWLVGAAWNIANVFALPIIVMSDTHIQPLDATKQSVAMIRKVWGESVIANVGIGVVAAASMVGYSIGLGLVTALIAAAGVHSAALVIAFITLLSLGILIISLVTSVLSGIIKAAIYHYATTGEAPETFNRDLLRTAMTPKKARKIFAQ